MVGLWLLLLQRLGKNSEREKGQCGRGGWGERRMGRNRKTETETEGGIEQQRIG